MVTTMRTTVPSVVTPHHQHHRHHHPRMLCSRWSTPGRNCSLTCVPPTAPPPPRSPIPSHCIRHPPCRTPFQVALIQRPLIMATFLFTCPVVYLLLTSNAVLFRTTNQINLLQPSSLHLSPYHCSIQQSQASLPRHQPVQMAFDPPPPPLPDRRALAVAEVVLCGTAGMPIVSHRGKASC